MFSIHSLAGSARRRVIQLPHLPSLRATLAVSGLLAAAGAAEAQSLGHFKGAIFRPESADWSVAPSPGGGLVLSNLGYSGLDGVSIELPPSAGSGVPEVVGIDLAMIDPTGTVLPVGAELEFISRGTVGGVADQDIGSLHLEKQPGGRVAYAYDFSPIGATSYTVEFWNDTTLLAVESGVVGTGGSGPLLLPNCDASPHCCWLGAVYYSGGHWYNAWWCPMEVQLNGNTHTNTNRVVVTPENPTMPVDELTGGAIHARQIPSIELVNLDLSGFGSVGTGYCSAENNSTGMSGIVTALGSNRVADNDLSIFAFQLPQNSFGYFVTSRFQAFVPNAGGSQGNLCVGQSTGRYLSQLGNTGLSGALELTVDLASLPQPTGSVSVSVGETWNFQCWHRDANPSVTSNFSEGYSITFQ